MSVSCTVESASGCVRLKDQCLGQYGLLWYSSEAVWYRHFDSIAEQVSYLNYEPCEG